MNEERNALILSMAQGGMTVRAIGAEVGITGARVAQLLQRMTGQARFTQQVRPKVRRCLGTRQEYMERVAEAKAAKFYNKVGDRDSRGCMPWLGYLDPAGYGRATMPQVLADRHGENKYTYAHRLAYIFANGSIPDGMTVDHICFNRSCCNPGHLQLLTLSQNAARKKRLVLNEKAPAPDTSTGPTTNPGGSALSVTDDGSKVPDSPATKEPNGGK